MNATALRGDDVSPLSKALGAGKAVRRNRYNPWDCKGFLHLSRAFDSTPYL
jgi:hypothetical protein